jgi:hypothetical protein
LEGLPKNADLLSKVGLEGLSSNQKQIPELKQQKRKPVKKR